MSRKWKTALSGLMRVHAMGADPSKSCGSSGAPLTPVAQLTARAANLAPMPVRSGATTRATGVGVTDVDATAEAAAHARAPSAAPHVVKSTLRPTRSAAAAESTAAPVATVAAMRTSKARENFLMARRLSSGLESSVFACAREAALRTTSAARSAGRAARRDFRDEIDLAAGVSEDAARNTPRESSDESISTRARRNGAELREKEFCSTRKREGR